MDRRDAVRGKRVGVYGLDYVMTVRDFRALDGRLRARRLGRRVRPRPRGQERARARVRPRQRPHQHRGLLDLSRAVRVRARPNARCWRPASSTSSRRAAGAGRWTWCSTGPNGQCAAGVQDRGQRPHQGDRHGAAVARDRGPGGHWVEVSRAICPGEPSADTQADARGYEEYYEAARGALHAGATAHDVHRAVSKGFLDRGFQLGHVTGHSIGMTMIECPKIGEGDETELRAGMVFSMHPHAISVGRAGVPLHAGHVARHGGRRRAARRPADEDLRRDGAAAMSELGQNRSSRARAAPTTSGTCAPTSCSPAEDAGRVDPPRRAALPDRAPDLRDLAQAGVERGRGGRPAGRRGRARAATRLLRRANDCFKLVTSALDMLEHMSPWEYTEVRKALGHGSGFDSPGFRELRRVRQPLGEAFHAAHERAGLTLVEVYTRGREFEALYQLAEQLIELDERVIVWRVRHFKVVQRMIGGRRDRHAGHTGRGDGPADSPLVLPRALGRAERADEHEPARMRSSAGSHSAVGTSAASVRRRRSSDRARRGRRDRDHGRAWEDGMHWFDTADAYGGGRSETFIGRWRARASLKGSCSRPRCSIRRSATPPMSALRQTGSAASWQAASSGSASTASISISRTSRTPKRPWTRRSDASKS